MEKSKIRPKRRVLRKPKTNEHIERFSPEWINAIPRWLARGIWEAIEESVEGGEHAKTTENERRKRQLAGGRLGESSRGTANIDRESMERHNRQVRGLRSYTHASAKGIEGAAGQGTGDGDMGDSPAAAQGNGDGDVGHNVLGVFDGLGDGQ